jgi:hypothetical protein
MVHTHAYLCFVLSNLVQWSLGRLLAVYGHDKDWSPMKDFTLAAHMTFVYKHVHLNVVTF